MHHFIRSQLQAQTIVKKYRGTEGHVGDVEQLQVDLLRPDRPERAAEYNRVQQACTAGSILIKRGAAHVLRVHCARKAGAEAGRDCGESCRRQSMGEATHS